MFLWGLTRAQTEAALRAELSQRVPCLSPMGKHPSVVPKRALQEKGGNGIVSVLPPLKGMEGYGKSIQLHVPLLSLSLGSLGLI